ncbi:hypothetical protein CH063_04937 [Colletotrichum higginsianum]|uniref:Uncharacterized protein n=1 Tax=Colletotrichum higginsianum (strain IMI 349063) TaxID=759273 RepID=H1UX76_COLHI|nr:hypothetical protein CH63R_13838 [Colletotrichum higginsianum IMI 349063]OBR02612.1 hypothetical protein CH63R_13838 [Colletotrichum higginsianum IMI 349063]CCF32577.1 hypothetical protein CH063_04937 [Colletotrichum higginsianum]
MNEPIGPTKRAKISYQIKVIETKTPSLPPTQAKGMISGRLELPALALHKISGIHCEDSYGVRVELRNESLQFHSGRTPDRRPIGIENRCLE